MALVSRVWILICDYGRSSVVDARLDRVRLVVVVRVASDERGAWSSLGAEVWGA